VIEQCYMLAGSIGVDPGPLTIRELLWMADGAARTLWQHTSSIMALITNCFRDTRKYGIVKPSDINPFEIESRPKGIPVGILKDKNLFRKTHVTKLKRKKV